MREGAVAAAAYTKTYERTQREMRDTLVEDDVSDQRAAELVGDVSIVQGLHETAAARGQAAQAAAQNRVARQQQRLLKRAQRGGGGGGAAAGDDWRRFS